MRRSASSVFDTPKSVRFISCRISYGRSFFENIFLNTFDSLQLIWIWSTELQVAYKNNATCIFAWFTNDIFRGYMMSALFWQKRV